MSLVHKASVKAQYDTIRLSEARRAAGQSWHVTGISASLQGASVVVALTYNDAALDQIIYLHEEPAFDVVGVEAAFWFQAALANLAPVHISD